MRKLKMSSLKNLFDRKGMCDLGVESIHISSYALVLSRKLVIVIEKGKKLEMLYNQHKLERPS